MRSNKEADIEEIIINNLDCLVSTLNKSNNKVIVSISGGIDSIVLLDVILKIKKKLPIDLSLFHMNYDMHCNADKMQNLCIRIANENKLKIFTKKINSKNLFKNTNLEAKARYVRYEKLSDICSKNKIDYILTAHHEDDQIETIYMHKE
ncbi:tRNA lysidine(34) synthetase TilS, partial [bacterium]|nr:tRNA lysidine(34) synthetase TilS [bacterium]